MKTIILYTVHENQPKIPYSADQEQGPIPQGYQGIFAEQDRLSSHGWLCKFSKNDPSHTCLLNTICILNTNWWMYL